MSDAETNAELRSQLAAAERERDEAHALLVEAGEKLAECCCNEPPCCDDDEPMERGEWCDVCDVVGKIAAALAACVEAGARSDRQPGYNRSGVIVVRDTSTGERAAAKVGSRREALGRRVREVWIEWAKKQPAPKPSWLVPWEGLSEPDREVDREIGETIADEELAGFAAVIAAAREVDAISDVEMFSECAALRAALASLDGEKGAG